MPITQPSKCLDKNVTMLTTSASKAGPSRQDQVSKHQANIILTLLQKSSQNGFVDLYLFDLRRRTDKR